MSVQLRDNAYFKDAKGRTSFIMAVTSTTKFAFADKWTGNKFDAEGKSAISPDYDLIEEFVDDVPALQSMVDGARAKAPRGIPANVVHFPESKEVRGLCVSVWCGDFGLLVADVESSSGPEGSVKVRRAWLESEAGSIGISDEFLCNFALNRGKRGFVSAMDLIAARAKEEAWG